MNSSSAESSTNAACNDVQPSHSLPLSVANNIANFNSARRKSCHNNHDGMFVCNEDPKTGLTESLKRSINQGCCLNQLIFLWAVSNRYILLQVFFLFCHCSRLVVHFLQTLRLRSKRYRRGQRVLLLSISHLRAFLYCTIFIEFFSIAGGCSLFWHFQLAKTFRTQRIPVNIFLYFLEFSLKQLSNNVY